jgi:hypothetical protein
VLHTLGRYYSFVLDQTSLSPTYMRQYLKHQISFLDISYSLCPNLVVVVALVFLISIFKLTMMSLDIYTKHIY